MTPRRAPNAHARGVTLGEGRETDLGRRKAFKDSGSTILVLSNGKNTEKQYLGALKRERWGQPFHISFKNYAPLALVDHGISEKINSGYDHVWCVCDVDNFNVADALKKADVCGVRIALSEPCFEVWLILHKVDWRRSFQNAKEAERELKKILPKWDKANLKMEDFRADIEVAAHRAKKLGEPPNNNPSSSMWQLVEFLKLVDEKNVN
ncbi:RloB family protein [Streptosporangium sp. NPDC006007]|uniref:RloB family protein n=1 Tax=Streptosporangium sp. NPDC006007 TaxID=3154575 RepID=UPI00339DB676